MKLDIDLEFQSLIPSLSHEEYNGLEQSLRTEGCRDALIIWNNIIIDGHNRYEICQKHNIPFSVIEKQFVDRNDIILWIINNQFSRRNLNAWQRTILALKYEEIFQKKAKEQHAIKHTEQYKEDVKEQISAPLSELERVRPVETTRQELAKIAKVSHDTIAKVKVIEQRAAPEVKKELETGTKSINEVYQDIKRDDKKDFLKIEVNELWDENNKKHIPKVLDEKSNKLYKEIVSVTCSNPFCDQRVYIYRIQKIELYTQDPINGNLTFVYCGKKCRDEHLEALKG